MQRKEVWSDGTSEYLYLTGNDSLMITRVPDDATRFYDFEVAQGWANKHFEVVEVDE